MASEHLQNTFFLRCIVNARGILFKCMGMKVYCRCCVLEFDAANINKNN